MVGLGREAINGILVHHLHCSISHNSRTVGVTQVSTDRGVGKQVVMTQIIKCYLSLNQKETIHCRINVGPESARPQELGHLGRLEANGKFTYPIAPLGWVSFRLGEAEGHHRSRDGEA